MDYHAVEQTLYPVCQHLFREVYGDKATLHRATCQKRGENFTIDVHWDESYTDERGGGEQSRLRGMMANFHRGRCRLIQLISDALPLAVMEQQLRVQLVGHPVVDVRIYAYMDDKEIATPGVTGTHLTFLVRTHVQVVVAPEL
jgi:hypothetical protein